MGFILMEAKYPNWFAVTAQHNFEKHLLPFVGQEGLHFLQLGVYTGDATEFLCKNILTGKNSWLHDVDTWEGSDEEIHKSIDFSEVIKIYKKRIVNVPVVPFAETTTSYLLDTARARFYTYDFIYIDADHTTVGVLLDAELSWPQLKSGGIMAFDDYNWGNALPLHLRPKPGIDLFMLRHDGEYELLEKNEQVWIRKS
jgi:hypothetical protein